MGAKLRRSVSANWPCEQEKLVDPPSSEPTWECPDGSCDCHAIEESEPLELTVLLCDEHARPMPLARCRVLLMGRVINEDQPNADAEGWLCVTVRRPLRAIALEWAPPETPLDPRFPYRMRYHAEIKPDDDRTSIKRRLHNLGFSGQGLLSENVKAFQRAFGYERITGEVEDIQADLLLFHDRGWIPPIEGDPEDGEEDEEQGPERTDEGQDESDPFQAFPKTSGQIRSKTKGKARRKAPPVPRADPPKKHKPAGGPPGAGTARPVPKGKLKLHVCCQFATQDRNGDVRTRCRWDEEEKNPHPVKGASIELFDMQGGVVGAFAAANPSPKTDRLGKVTLKLGGVPDGDYVLRLNPPVGHELRGAMRGPITDDTAREAQLRSVGPEDRFTKDPPGHMRFRILEIAITIRKGALQKASVVKEMRRAGDVAFHGVVVDQKPSALKVDWKPDWVQCRFTDGLKKEQPDPSRPGTPLKRVHFIILHHTDSDTPGAAINQFLSATSERKTGAHYVIDVDGHATKMADETISVRHAGECFWHGLDSHKDSTMHRAGFNWNDISIGIEQVHRGASQYSAEQIAGTKNLIERIRRIHGVSHHNVLGHGDIALHPATRQRTTPKTLGEKSTCPGERYNWPFLERSGNATRPGSAAVPHARYGGFFNDPNNPGAIIDRSAAPSAIAGLQLTLSELGYFVNATSRYDEATVRAVEAFQNRYFSGERRRSAIARATSAQQGVDFETIKMMHKALAARGGFKL